MTSLAWESQVSEREAKEESLGKKKVQERVVRKVGGESGGTGDLEPSGRGFWGRTPVLGVKDLQSDPGLLVITLSKFLNLYAFVSRRWGG